jgi:hypothetical protein
MGMFGHGLVTTLVTTFGAVFHKENESSRVRDCAWNVVLNCEGKDKPRAWQTGKVLDSDQARRYVGSVSDASATDYGSAVDVTGSSRPVYLVTQTYVVEIDDYIYVGQERLRWRWSKPADLTVNAPVKIAIEKDKMYLVGDDSKEHEATIVKKILKETPGK